MNQKSKGTDQIRCSFCGRTPDEVQSIIAGPDVYICDLCVSSSVDIIRNNLSSVSARRNAHENLTDDQMADRAPTGPIQSQTGGHDPPG